ncbi:MAG: DUF1294 domain-containing protein [Anaerolineaceae bacterium]|jgi:uncharacterized membrane protein YsdA (DUF1294 family)
MELIFIPLSFITFILFGYDKLQAKNDGWRVPEKTLLLLGVFGGAIGGLVGMKIFHHKTRKNYFWIVYGVAVILQIAFVFYRRY